jgi:signal transduction histidine kinase
MPIQDDAGDLLATRSFPDLAQAIRARQGRIMDRWENLVRRTLPRADALPVAQLRDHLPQILEQIATALETEPQYRLIDTTQAHGARRFHDHYDIQAVIIEFRLLRRVLVEELNEALGDTIAADEMIALDMGVDTAIQESLIAFVRLQQAQLQAVTKAEAKYLSFLSHDLRNNLNNVTLTLEMVGAELAGLPQFAERAEDIAAAQRAIQDTVNGMAQLLQAEQLRKGTFKPRHEALDLSTVAAEVIRQLTPQANAKGIDLVLEAPQEPATVNSDRCLIALMLQNLVGNAIKYSARGPVRVQVRAPAKDRNQGWALSVADQGPGIADPARVSAPFVRGETQGQQGEGLGLSIVHDAGALLGAHVSADSKLGVGTVFHVILPAED